jgi:hypothetical protein
MWNDTLIETVRAAQGRRARSDGGRVGTLPDRQPRRARGHGERADRPLQVPRARGAAGPGRGRRTGRRASARRATS